LPLPFTGALLGLLLLLLTLFLSSSSLFCSSWVVSVLLRFGSVSSAFDCSRLQPQDACGAAGAVGAVEVFAEQSLRLFANID